MPWRKLITTRRHPAAWVIYAVAALTGWLYVGHVFDAQISAVAAALGGMGWAWTLVMMFAAGGTLGLIGLLIPDKRVDDALAVEFLGALLSFFGTTTQILITLTLAGWDQTGWMLNSVLALGYVWRAVQCLIDRRIAVEYAQKTQARRSRESGQK